MKKPIEVSLVKEKKYAWCTCGLAQKQPFCDGSHKALQPPMTPLIFCIDENKESFLCTCKMTKTPPYCDGSHKNSTN